LNERKYLQNILSRDAAAMAIPIKSLLENVRNFILNPPLAPGGDANLISPVDTSIVLETLDSSNESNLNNINNDPFLVRYLPLLLLISLFWPVLVTLVAASISASAWLFWLVVGAAFGILQLLFVLYNFVMICGDIGILTVLKTFAMLRSFIRYYTFKMSDAAGIHLNGSRRTKDGKLRRRKDWREEVDRAKTFKEYCKIEIYEPAANYSSAMTSGKSTTTKTKFSKRASSSVGYQNSKQMNNGTQSPTSPTKSKSSIQAESPPSPMRKIKSCVHLNKSNSKSSRKEVSTSKQKRLVSTLNTKSWKHPLRRNYSSFSLPSSTTDEDDEDDVGNPRWQKNIENDMGMTGTMLLTTLSRLKEARLQASSTSSDLSNSCEKDVKIMDEKLVILGDVGNDKSDDDSINSISSEDGSNENYNKNTINAATSQRPRSTIVDNTAALKFLLAGIVKRNHLSLDDFLINDARSVAERGQHTLNKETREAIDQYGEEVEKCMDWLATGPVWLGSLVGSGGNGGKSSPLEGLTDPKEIMQMQRDELGKRLTLVKRMKQNMGRTALMLSGGGAQAMYHLGTIKALVESEIYEHIHVISGTSGGSITAAMCAIKSPEELLRDVCVPTVSTDYMLTGEMKEKNIRWFPKLVDMGAYWLKHGILADSAEFRRCCEFYYKDITFEEAFEMTGKHVCITVSASRVSSSAGVQRLLLNHISTPHVTLASAVAASCALPGFMKPAKLMIKDSRGKQVPFEVDGVEWIDGSVQADLPFKRISTLFNISNYVVAQTNFHVLPFLNKAHHPNINTLYWKLFQMCMWDVRGRVLNLSQLGLFPRIFGQDVTKVFKQKYYGNLTLVPRFTTMQLFGLKSLVNPTVEDMKIYLQNGQIAAWPFLHVLKEMIRIERAVDSCLSKLERRVQSVASGVDVTMTNTHDDVDSISSSYSATKRAHFPGLGREAELLKEKNRELELENAELRKAVFHLQRALGITHPNNAMNNGVRDAVRSLEGKFNSFPSVVEHEMREEQAEEKKSL